MEPEKQLHTFLDGGNLIYFPQYLADEEATELLQLLHYSEDSVNGNIPWALNKVGEKANIPEARITALLGEADGLTYSYSFQTKVASKWPAEVHQLKTKLEAIVGHPYNVVLCNWYQSGKNFVGWHSDDETDLVEGSTIACISLGETRLFQFRHNKDAKMGLDQTQLRTKMNSEGYVPTEEEKGILSYKVGTSTELNKEFTVKNGTLVVMSGTLQKFWRHRIPPTKQEIAPRLSLTFRWVKNEKLVAQK